MQACIVSKVLSSEKMAGSLAVDGLPVPSQFLQLCTRGPPSPLPKRKIESPVMRLETKDYLKARVSGRESGGL